MARDPGTYSEEIVQEFYVSYVATLRGSITKRSKPLAQDPLTSTMVRSCPVDVSPATISCFLYGPTTGHSWSLNTSEFDYRWDIVRSGAFQRNAEQREVVLLWLARYIAADGEHAEWVAAPRLGIRKATLNFVAKFFWLLVRNRVSSTKADNQLTWDRAVMVAALVAGVEIDFARMLLAEIHERAFRTSTTYPFPCLIFHLCRDSGVPIWHCDRLVHPTRALDINLIRDEANVAAPRRDPQIEADLANLRTNVDAILATPSVETQASPTTLADDTVLHALFSETAKEGPAPTHAKVKRHRSHRTEEEKAHKRQCRQEKEARRTSIVDEELRQQRVRERVAGASSTAPVVEIQPVLRAVVSTTDGSERLIESTTEGATITDVGITEGAPTIVPAGSRKPNPPAC
uniref:Integrase core domain containing protein n=1 Tax=Solanum tuberosum TaxID=4113 RepID=M1DL71_SOLTU